MPGAYAAISAFSPDGLYAVIEGPSVGSLWPKLWDMKEDRLVREFNQGTALSGRPASFYFPQAFSADSKYLLSGFGDVDPMVWDVSTGKVLSHLKGHTERILSAAFFSAYYHLPLDRSLLGSVLLSAAVVLVEAFSPHGLDNLTIQITAGGLASLIVHLWG